MGDGVLSYFGYPQAHEDDPIRAIHSGLAILNAVTEIEPKAALTPKVRIGIATGSVVVGDLIGEGVARESNVVGATPNLAARLQSLADPGTLVVALETRRLAGAVFEYRDLGKVSLKGFDSPIEAWQVLRPSAVESRFEAEHQELTPLVGRREELELLLRRWHQAKAGEGRVVLLCGEPGIGKSRLARALEQEVATEPHFRLRYFCSPYHRDSPLHPFIAQLEHAAGFVREDEPGTKLEKLELLLAQSANDSAETLTLLPDLLSLSGEGSTPPLLADPQRKRDMTLSALVQQLEGLAAQRPVLVIFEDAHWADSTSLELLDRAAERFAQMPVLAVITFRPEFQARWVGQAHVAFMSLTPLAQRETVSLVAGITGGKAVPVEILERIVQRTDGIPLFVEELTKSLLEGGLLRQEAGGDYVLAGPLPPLAIPTSLQDSLMARLDRLAPVKEVAQIGAVIGREFSYELLAAVAGRRDAELRAALDQLTEAGIIFRHGTVSHATFAFKHALVQDAAYSTLLRRQRQSLHARIATVLVEKFPLIIITEPETIAHHQTAGGLFADAMESWLKAGQLSGSRSANIEAIQHLQRGLECLNQLAPNLDRDRRELALRCAMGPALAATSGYSSSITVGTYQRARELIESTGDSLQFDRVLSGLFIAYWTLAEYEKARLVAEELAEKSEQLGDRATRCVAYRILGSIHNVIGDFDRAVNLIGRALSLYSPEHDGQLAYRYVHDLGVAAKSQLSIAQLHRGYTQQSITLAAEALEDARRLGHFNTLGLALFYAGAMHAYLRQDIPTLRERAEELMRHGAVHRMPQWKFIGTCFKAAAIASGTRDEEDAVTLIDIGLKSGEEFDCRMNRPLWLKIRADALAQIHQVGPALDELRRALDLANRTGEYWIIPDLLIRIGDMQQSLQKEEDAKHSFTKAAKVAAEIGSVLLEARALLRLKNRAEGQR